MASTSSSTRSSARKRTGAEHVALLRGVNVGGHRITSMAELREKFAAAGLTSVKTLGVSGNVVFGGKATNLSELAGTDVIVRSASQWRRVIETNPFENEAKSDPGRLLVMFLDRKPGPLFEWPGPETMRLFDRELFIYYPNGAGRSKLTGALIEKRLGVRGTARNWNTVMKLAAMLE